MEKQNRKHWRKLVKKLQRKRRRQKKAKERDKLEEEETLRNSNDPAYQEWLQQQKQLEEFQKLEEKQQHDEEVEAWLRRELIAQQQFRLELKRREADEAAKEELRLQQEKELEEREAALKQTRETKERLGREAAEEFELMLQKMDDYLNNESSRTPTELKRYVQSRPGEKFCEFYERTNCCRYGIKCGFNHRRPLLGRIILIHHFFSHSLLEPLNHKEYATADSNLELSERDLRDDYDAFFEDVVPELESFGKIVNFRTVRNITPHLRGNVFVEYADKRSALRAFSKLQGRYYASKRLIVEFSNLLTWRGAVCGLSIARKCPRGDNCNYLHVFKNPNNKYNTLLENKQTTVGIKEAQMNAYNKTNEVPPSLSWNDVCGSEGSNEKRNWRWSESPEREEKTVKDKPATSKSCIEDKDVSESKEIREKDKKKRRRHKKSSKKSSNRDERHESSRSSSRSKRKRDERDDSGSSSRRSKRKRDNSKSINGKDSKEKQLRNKSNDN